MSVHTHPVPPVVDTRDLRRTLGKFATGITVITTRTASGEPIGFTANSFSSVSLDPPLVLWNLSKGSPNLAHFEACSHYAVNVLSADQMALSQVFASPVHNRFEGIVFEDGAGGAPLIPGCCAWFECVNEIRHPGGDHIIFVGRVERFARAERPPLVYHGGHYCVVSRHPDAS